MIESGFATRTATGEAASAARKLAGGDVSSLWRAPGNGTIEVVREHGSHVELWRVHSDGSTEMVDSAKTPFRRRLFGWAMRIGFVVLAISFVTAAIASSASPALEDVAWVAFGCTFAAMFATGFLAPSGRNVVAGWTRERFGGAEGWSHVPREGELERATGEQQIAVAAAADSAGGTASARVLDDGTVEVEAGRTTTRIDPAGRVLHTETRPAGTPNWGARAAVVGAVALVGLAFWLGDGWSLLAALAGAAALAYLALRLAGRNEEPVDPDELAQWKQVRTDDPGD